MHSPVYTKRLIRFLDFLRPVHRVELHGCRCLGQEIGRRRTQNSEPDAVEEGRVILDLDASEVDLPVVKAGVRGPHIEYWVELKLTIFQGPDHAGLEILLNFRSFQFV